MSVYALIASHSNCSIELRERLVITRENQCACYADLSNLPGVRELYLLSTCNRTEIYALCDTPAQFDALVAGLAKFAGIEHRALDSAQRLQGLVACGHLLKVACGMDSMVLGEAQILGQIKAAYAQARLQGTLGSELEQLMQFCFAKAKEIRTAMPLGRQPVSIASTMVRLSQQIFEQFDNKRLLLVGAGDTIELVARHMVRLGVREIDIVNRTYASAVQLAGRFRARAWQLYDLPELLPGADMVVTATSSQLPIIGKGMVERAVTARRDHSLALFDLAVPRDIEPQVAELDGVFVYCIEDLGKIIQQNKSQRQAAAAAAQELIDRALEQYRQQVMQAKIARSLVAPFRQHAETLRNQELELALAKLRRGEAPETVLTRLAHGLTQKLLHQPTMQARKLNPDTDPLAQLLHTSEEISLDKTRH